MIIDDRHVRRCDHLAWITNLRKQSFKKYQIVWNNFTHGVRGNFKSQNLRYKIWIRISYMQDPLSCMYEILIQSVSPMVTYHVHFMKPLIKNSGHILKIAFLSSDSICKHCGKRKPFIGDCKPANQRPWRALTAATAVDTFTHLTYTFPGDQGKC